MQPHRIRRQRWQVKVPSPEAAFAWRRELRACLASDILPAFERAFSAFAPGDEILRIPRLTLNLQLGAGADTATELADRIEAQLRAALGAMFGSAPARQGAPQPSASGDERASPAGDLASGQSGWQADTGGPGTPSAHPGDGVPQPASASQAREPPPAWQGAPQPSAAGQDRASPAGGLASGGIRRQADTEEPGTPSARLGDEAQQPQGVAAPQPRQGVRHLNAAEHDRALLVEYLTSGRLAWHADTGEIGTPIARLGEAAQQLVCASQGLAAASAGTLATRAIMYFRLLHLLPEPTRETLLQAASRHGAQLFTTLCRLAAVQALGNFLRLRVQAMLLALRDHDLPDTRSGCVAELLVACAAMLAGSTEDAALGRSIEALLGPGEPAAPAPGNQASLPDANRAIQTATAGGHGTQATPAGGDRATRTPTQAPAAAGKHPAQTFGDDRDGSALPKEIAWHVLTLEPAAAQASALLARDAGLVLLHPFLPRLLEARAITADRGLPATRLPRAAALLHWLATGHEEVFEFELSLVKVLLGLAPNDPLPVASGLLLDADRAEADALLAAAIGHWSVLGNTSLAGLRASFLQRRGLLREGERGWHLQVEPESFDLLLRQLPWGIGIVKLPWMTRALFTDWPTP